MPFSFRKQHDGDAPPTGFLPPRAGRQISARWTLGWLVLEEHALRNSLAVYLYFLSCKLLTFGPKVSLRVLSDSFRNTFVRAFLNQNT